MPSAEVISVITKAGSGPMKLSASVEVAPSTLQPDRRGQRIAGRLSLQCKCRPPACRATPVTPLDVLAPGEHRNADYYDNFTVSSKLGFDVTPDFEPGPGRPLYQHHLRYTGEDYRTFPAVPAAQQSASNTDEYYGRATAHLVSLDGGLNQDPRRRLRPQPDGNAATADCGKSQ